MISIDKALQIIVDTVEVLEPISMPILEARGKVLAEDIISHENIPSYDYAVTPGCAVRARDTEGASPSNPIEVVVDGELVPGQPWLTPLKPMHTVKICSGAAVPQDADSILPEEHFVRLPNGRLRIYKPAQPGDNIRRKGEDIAKNTLVLPKGKKLNASDIGVLSVIGLTEVKCYRAPKVAFLVTGSSLADNSGPVPEYMMRSPVRYTLYSQLAEYGAEPVDLGIAGHDREIITQKIIDGLMYDMFISSIGPAQEDFAYVKKVLERLGMDTKFWRVAIKPGKPLIYGMVGKTPVFGLSGHPFASFIVLEQLIRPALMKMMGMQTIKRAEVFATLTKDIRGDDGVTCYVRATVALTSSGFLVTPAVKRTNSVRALSTINGFIIVPPNTGYLKTGDKVRVQILAEPEPQQDINNN
ncbi:MAG: molybdopterin molybdotransferase MoeA [candidate division Zixibacteria bacterium]|jgi:molybdopterin molybdotransferase|nr:molybdopterin molybdotransferase MoeA [candidate division Zixibacteria bacterium]